MKHIGEDEEISSDCNEEVRAQKTAMDLKIQWVWWGSNRLSWSIKRTRRKLALANILVDLSPKEQSHKKRKIFKKSSYLVDQVKLQLQKWQIIMPSHDSSINVENFFSTCSTCPSEEKVGLVNKLSSAFEFHLPSAV